MRWIYLSFLLISFCSCKKKETVQLFELFAGDTKLQLEFKTKEENSSMIFINLHDDENTCIDAFSEWYDDCGGTYFHLINRGERNVVFTVSGHEGEFDPNGIFSSQGIERQLKKNNCFNPKSEAAVKKFSEDFLELLDLNSHDFVISLHNNSDGNFSVHSYIADTSRLYDALEFNLSRSQDEDDFFIVTERKFFEPLKRNDFNVVLLNPASPEDDGSLSDYCNKHGIDYINVEAQDGHLEEQKAMIEFVIKKLAPEQ